MVALDGTSRKTHAPEKWVRVTQRAPCPICNGKTWCTVSPDGAQVRCMRASEGAYRTDQQHDGSEAYLHWLNQPIVPPRSRYTAPQPLAPDVQAQRAVYALVVAHCAADWPQRAQDELVRRFGGYADDVRRLFPSLGYSASGDKLPRRLADAGRMEDARRAGVIYDGGALGKALRARIIVPYIHAGQVCDLRGVGFPGAGDGTKALSLVGNQEARGSAGIFFNHDVLTGTHGGTVHLVGGEWKTMALAVAGLPALGTRGEGELTDSQIHALTAAGITDVVLHIDAEEPKEGETLSAGRRLGARKAQRLAAAGFAVTIAEPPRAPTVPKVDPDALLREAGTAALCDYAAAAVPLAAFLATHGLTELPTPPSGTTSQRDNLVPFPGGGRASGWPGDRELTAVAGGTLVYRSEGEEPGIVLVGKKEERYLLRGTVAVESVAAPAPNTRGQATIRLRVTPPRGDTVEVAVSREGAHSGEVWETLAATGAIPPKTQKDLDALHQALDALAVDTPRRQVLVPTLGWHGTGERLAWVLGDGAVTAGDIRYEEAAYAAAIPASWPQRLPPRRGDGAPDVPDIAHAGVIAALLGAFGSDCYALPALLGTLARVALPLDNEGAGRLSYVFELYGRTGSLKTSFVNWMLALFSGAGYAHDTPTMISDGVAGDTRIGLDGKRAQLCYHGYADIDLNLGPDEGAAYEEQQQHRAALLKADGNIARAGTKGRREGGSEERPTPGGVVITTGEHDPHFYTIPRGLSSLDARAVTFLLPTPTDSERRRRYALSLDLAARRANLQRLQLGYVRWLAHLGRAAVTQRYGELVGQAREAIIARQESEASQAHEQVRGQLVAILTGLTFYAQFLRECDAEHGAVPVHLRCVDGGTVLATQLDAFHAGLIGERLRASHDLMMQYEAHQGGRSSEAMLSERIRDAIYSALVSGEGYLSDDADKFPEYVTLPVGYGVRQAGWQQVDSGVNAAYRPGKMQLGRFAEGGAQIRLRPEEVYRQLLAKLKPCPTKAQCWRALEEASVLTKQGEHYGHKDRGAGSRVLVVPAAWLYPTDRESPTPPPAVPHEPPPIVPEPSPSPVAPIASLASVTLPWCPNHRSSEQGCQRRVERLGERYCVVCAASDYGDRAIAPTLMPPMPTDEPPPAPETAPTPAPQPVMSAVVSGGEFRLCAGCLTERFILTGRQHCVNCYPAASDPPTPATLDQAGPVPLPWCLNHRGTTQGCPRRVGRAGDRYCAICIGAGYDDTPANVAPHETDTAPVAIPASDDTDGVATPRAVLTITDDGAYLATPDGQASRLPYTAEDVATIGALVNFAERHGSANLWLDPHSALHARLAETIGQFLSDAQSVGIRAGIDEGLRPIYTAHRGHRAVTLALPAPNGPTRNWEHGGEVQARAIAYAGAALGLPFRGSPSWTGRDLLYKKNVVRGWCRVPSERFTALAEAPERATGHTRDIAWRRFPTAAEDAADYVHVFDKTAAYLSMCSSVDLPIGTPHYHEGPDAAARAAGRTVPAGLWRVDVAYGDSPYTGRELPAVSREGVSWLWTPDLRVARDLGYRIEILGGILWPEQHRILNTWKETIWAARLALEEPASDYADTAARRVAVGLIKDLYRHTIGMFAHAPGGEIPIDGEESTSAPRWWHRPEWNQLIVAEAHARMFRHIERARAAGAVPLYAYVDNLAFFGAKPDPWESFPAGLPANAEKCGAFHHLHTWPGTDIAAALHDPRKQDVNRRALPSVRI